MLNVGTKTRQFMNVVTEKCNRGSYCVFTDEGRGGLYSLRRIKASDLFYGSTEEALLKESEQEAMAAAPCPMEMTRSRLPRPLIKFNQSRPVDNRMNFWPFYGAAATSDSSKIFCVDAAGQAILYDSGTGTLETLPRLRMPMGGRDDPVALFASLSRDAPDPAHPDALYVMDKRQGSFEALFYGDPSPHQDRLGRADKFVWQWRQLPMPPFTRDRAHGCIGPYVLMPNADGGGGTICVSSLTDGVGTYCFDTGSEGWTKAGSWRLPFGRRGQIVPELEGLCFGMSSYYPNDLVAVDLSSICTDGALPPKVQHHWPVIDMRPAGCTPTDVNMAYMGAGKFSVAKIFRQLHYEGARHFVDHKTVVYGVEVVRENGGAPKSKPKLRMIKHKCVCYRLLNHRIHVL